MLQGSSAGGTTHVPLLQSVNSAAGQTHSTNTTSDEAVYEAMDTLSVLALTRQRQQVEMQGTSVGSLLVSPPGTSHRAIWQAMSSEEPEIVPMDMIKGQAGSSNAAVAPTHSHVDGCGPACGHAPGTQSAAEALGDEQSCIELYRRAYLSLYIDATFPPALVVLVAVLLWSGMMSFAVALVAVPLLMVLGMRFVVVKGKQGCREMGEVN
jgi:hypothetical protein